MTKKEFIEAVASLPDDAPLVISRTAYADSEDSCGWEELFEIDSCREARNSVGTVFGHVHLDLLTNRQRFGIDPIFSGETGAAST